GRCATPPTPRRRTARPGRPTSSVTPYTSSTEQAGRLRRQARPTRGPTEPGHRRSPAVSLHPRTVGCVFDDLSHRERRWASTMHGFAADVAAGAPVATRTAHAQPGPTVGVASPLSREEREEIEDRLLAPGATRAVGAGNRAREEAPDPRRTCFERDRDRILHASTFRRLAGKTQVFVFPTDHQRTRLTHALEVAQVAASIARALRLNVALTEAIALGHDCGHGPGGHA